MDEPREEDQESTDDLVDEVVTEEPAATGEAGLEAHSAAAENDENAKDVTAAPEPSPLETLAAERDDLKERWLRAMAELDNVRKRSRREVTEARRFAQADVLRAMLDVADNFERAQASMATDTETTAASLREGFELIHQRFQAVLRDRGVEIIEALETEFDPNCHEAVGQTPREETAHGTVIEVVQQGYRFGDMVLRPARVIIAS